MSSVYESRFNLISAVLDYLSFERTDYYESDTGVAHFDYLKDRIDLHAKDLVKAIEKSGDKPVGWDDEV